MSILTASSSSSKRAHPEGEFPLSGDGKRFKTEVCPQETDIIFFGHAKLTLEHSGNAAFVDTIKRCLHLYRKSGDKDKIAKGIVEGLVSHLPPVRFLFRERTSGSWSALATNEAVAVTSHALLTINNQQLANERRRQEAIAASSYRKSSWQPKGIESSMKVVVNNAITHTSPRASLQPTSDGTTQVSPADAYRPEEVRIDWPAIGDGRSSTTLLNREKLETSSPASSGSPGEVEDDLTWTADDLDKVMKVLEC